MRKRCSGYMLNVSGILRHACRCHWMWPVMAPFHPAVVALKLKALKK